MATTRIYNSLSILALGAHLWFLSHVGIRVACIGVTLPTRMSYFIAKSSHFAPAFDKRLGLRRLTAWFGVIALFCCLAMTLAQATDHPSAVQITVLDEKNQPVADATISVMLADKQVAQAATDAAGKAAFTLSTSGAYVVSINKKGYLNTETEIEVTAGQQLQPVDMVLNSVALSQQSVDVKGDPASPVADDSGVSQSLSPVQAKQSPTRPVTLTDALPLIPGIVRGQDASAGQTEHDFDLLHLQALY